MIFRVEIVYGKLPRNGEEMNRSFAYDHIITIYSSTHLRAYNILRLMPMLTYDDVLKNYFYLSSEIETFTLFGNSSTLSFQHSGYASTTKQLTSC